MHTNRIPALFALVAAVALVACERAREDPATSSPSTGYDVPFASEAELATRLSGLCLDAREANQPLLIEFSAAWCSDCRRLHEMKQEPALAEELDAWPAVIVNVGRFDRHRPLLDSLGVESIAHWEVLAPTSCEEAIDTWPRLARRTLEVSSGAARNLSPADLARWLAKLRGDYQS